MKSLVKKQVRAFRGTGLSMGLRAVLAKGRDPWAFAAKAENEGWAAVIGGDLLLDCGPIKVALKKGDKNLTLSYWGSWSGWSVENASTDWPRRSSCFMCGGRETPYMDGSSMMAFCPRCGG